MNQINCGNLVLAWEDEQGTIRAERKHYSNPDRLSNDSVFRDRLAAVSRLLDDSTITGEEAVAALLPVIAAYGIELSHGPITVFVEAETIATPEQ